MLEPGAVRTGPFDQEGSGTGVLPTRMLTAMPVAPEKEPDQSIEFHVVLRNPESTTWERKYPVGRYRAQLVPGEEPATPIRQFPGQLSPPYSNRRLPPTLPRVA